MTNISIILAALTIAVMAAGCKPSNPDENSLSGETNAPSATNAWDKTKETATNSWAEVKEGATNAWATTKEATTNAWTDIKDSFQSTKDYTYDRKDDFVSSANADLNALDQKLQELSDKAANASDSVKAEAQTKIQDLRTQRAALNTKLDNVKNATEANWDDARNDFNNAYEDLKNSLKQMWQWLDDKINQ
ncbi:MAG TPA: hypothetical protein VGM58_02205 [Verrucomicrobiae bacterium]|jgi:chromosome segregation ATPase